MGRVWILTTALKRPSRRTLSLSRTCTRMETPRYVTPSDYPSLYSDLNIAQVPELDPECDNCKLTFDFGFVSASCLMIDYRLLIETRVSELHGH